MIKFGETYCGLLDTYDIAREWMSKHLGHDMREPVAPPQSQVTQRGSNLLYFNHPPLPKPMVNRFVVPSGATRWSYGLLYVTRTQLDSISAELDGGAGVLELSSAHQGNEDYLPVKLTMWPLRPLPLPPAIVNVNRESAQNVGEDAFLLPVVDGRYWWQFLNVGLISAAALADPDELLTYLLGLVPEDVTTKTLQADYTILPDVTSNDYESLPVVLDSVAAQLGLTLVPDMTASSHTTAGAGGKFALLSCDTSLIIHADNFSGFGTLDGAAAATPEFFGAPLQVAGDEFESFTENLLPESVRVRNGTDWEVVTAATAGWTENTIADSEVVLRYSWDGTVTTALAERIATDYYDRYEKQYDMTFVGMQKMQPTSYTDCLVYDIISRKKEVIERLRMRSIPYNLYPELPAAETSGGGEIMHFDIDEVDCDGTGYWSVTPTEYSGGCESPPGADDYTGLYYVRPRGGSVFTDNELEATGQGVAVYTYNLQTCERYWLEINHFADQGC